MYLTRKNVGIKILYGLTVINGILPTHNFYGSLGKKLKYRLLYAWRNFFKWG